MVLIPLTHPDEVTAQLRLRDIYRRQRVEAGFGATNTDDLLAESDIVVRLLDVQKRLILNEMEEIVRVSNEKQS